MGVLPKSIRASDGVKWRVYEDGIVVFVPASCETHILPLSLRALFEPGSVKLCMVDDNSRDVAPCGELSEPEPLVSRHIVEELVGLKIFDVIS